MQKAELKKKEADANIAVKDLELKKMEVLRKRNELLPVDLIDKIYLSYTTSLTYEVYRMDKVLINYLEELLQNKLNSEDLHKVKKDFNKFYEKKMSERINRIIEQQKKDVESL